MSFRGGKGLFITQQRLLRGRKRKLPEPIKRWNIKKGDLVEVLAGRDKGKHGKVVATDHFRNRLYVQGMNTHVVTVESSGFSGKMQREAPLHYSNVALVDPEDNKPCRVKYMYTEDREKIRVSERSGRAIPFPVKDRDFTKYAFPDGPMDTKPEKANHVTYIPSLVTFDEEMAERFKTMALSKKRTSNNKATRPTTKATTTTTT